MASTLYAKAREKFARAQINWDADTIKAILIDASNYILNADTHEFLDSIPAAARIGTAVALTGKTSVGGACDANDTTFPAVSGASIEAIVLYKDTGTESTSPLLYYVDTATGLPITPNTGDIIVNWDNGTNKIFRL